LFPLRVTVPEESERAYFSSGKFFQLDYHSQRCCLSGKHAFDILFSEEFIPCYKTFKLLFSGADLQMY
tara:strand:- start:463 stop:666 length:204 start_codon:yes stop_codon:yes gene_type:complete